MIKQIFLPIVLVAAFIVAVGMFIKKSPSIRLPDTNIQTQTEVSKTLKIGSKSVEVEVVDSEELRAKGLSGRSSLEENKGMLFVFEKRDVEPVFWMKDMEFAIDIIWIDNDKIVRIDKEVPSAKKGVPDGSLTRYAPGQPIDYVLEVSSGFSDKNTIKIGDSVTLPVL
jgi:hypothetical protein